MIEHSAIAKILPAQNKDKILDLFTRLEISPIDTCEAYYFLMNAITTLIADDHSSIHLGVFKHQQNVRYSGVVFTFINGQFIVIHS